MPNATSDVKNHQIEGSKSRIYGSCGGLIRGGANLGGGLFRGGVANSRIYGIVL